MSDSDERTFPVDEFGLEVRTRLNRTTGRKTTLFFDGANECPVAVIDSSMARQYAAYWWIRLDLDDASTWLAEAHEMLPPAAPTETPGKDTYTFIDDASGTVIKGLWFAAIVNYAKCFAQADGRRLQLNKRNSVPPGLHAKHDKIVTYRNALAAHAGSTVHESAETVLVLSPDRAANKRSLRTTSQRLQFEDDRSDSDSFGWLIETVKRHVDAKMAYLRETIIARELDPLGADHWYRVAGLASC